MSRKKLIETALENCEVYRYEYILNKPTQNLENMLEIALDELLMQNLIKAAQVSFFCFNLYVIVMKILHLL